MAERITTLALMAFLTGSSVLTSGQATSTQSANDAATTESQTASHLKDNHSESHQAHCIDSIKKDKRKTKHDVKPAPSKEEQQEAEKMLLGIFG